MAIYNIQKKTPASNWYTIHKSFCKEDADEFLMDMADGGYDKSGINGTCCLMNGTAHHFDVGGDLIEFRVVES